MQDQGLQVGIYMCGGYIYTRIGLHSAALQQLRKLTARHLEEDKN